MKRRNFIKQICNACVVSTLPISLLTLQSCSDSASSYGSDSEGSVDNLNLDLSESKYSSLKNIGGAVALGSNNFDLAGLLVYRRSESSYVAFSRRCPHAGTSINSFSNGIASCPSHGARFDTNGSAVSGPTNADLKKYMCSVNGTILTITK